MKRPFCLIPWQNSFLDELKDLVAEECRGSPERAVVVFPHTRPKRYLMNAFARDAALPRPLLLPRLFTVQELFAYCRARLPLPPARRIRMPDAVALLRRCVLDLAPDDPVHACLHELEPADFFPWGSRLFTLMEECLSQGVLPRDITHAQAEAAPLPAALLSMLGSVHASFQDILRARELSTPGLDAYDTALHVRLLPPLFPRRQLFLAGFTALTGTEDALLRHLWENGALMCLHSDPALAGPGGLDRAHWSCADHAALLRAWRTDAALRGEPEQRKGALHFTAGYDLHSQLHAFARRLEEEPDMSSTAVVLSDPALLMPVLHHLPRKDVNISMGYPLRRAPVWRLLELALRLQEDRREDGRYHWRGLLEFLRHPYLRALKAGELGLRGALRVLEESLLDGDRFVDPHALLRDAGLEPEARELCGRLLRCGLDGPAGAKTPRSFALALEAFCRLLLEQGEHLWRAYPLDAECLFRLMEEVLPELLEYDEADGEFPPAFLHALVRECAAAARAPFEADPIIGMQVLGMLETRLLRFDRVFILDATDDRLPGAPRRDPLLPDALRAALDLPHTDRRDQLVAHTLHRLMAGAEETHFYWQEGVQRTAFFEGKKQRSRFVEELLWRMEEREGRLFSPGASPVETAPVAFAPPGRDRKGIGRGPELDAAMRRMLSLPLSASRLNGWLRCPLRFAWEHLCRIRPLKERGEGDDPAAVGEFLHLVLREAFTPYLGKTVRRGELRAEDLRACFARLLRASKLRELLPADGYFMLEIAGPARLERFLAHQPEETKILALEREYACDVAHPWGGHRLAGTVDRVDLREGGLLVLDYKSGTLAGSDAGLWTDGAFWNDLARVKDDGDGGPLSELAERLPDLQLPCYVLLCAQANLSHGLHNPACNAAWVELRENGEERPLFSAESAEIAREELLRRLRLLFGAVVRNMRGGGPFLPREGRHCGWCPYVNLCLR